jgi:hypothetical protein
MFLCVGVGICSSLLILLLERLILLLINRTAVN